MNLLFTILFVTCIKTVWCLQNIEIRNARFGLNGCPNRRFMQKHVCWPSCGVSKDSATLKTFKVNININIIEQIIYLFLFLNDYTLAN